MIYPLKSIPNIHCLLYADDLFIWMTAAKRRAKSFIESSLNSLLYSLNSCCMENNMVVNLNRCATQTTFSLMHLQITPELFFIATTLDNVEAFTYLGIVLT